MQPLQITLRGIPHSDVLEQRIRENAAKLQTFYDRIQSCHVVVEAPHQHHHKGSVYSVGIELRVPGGEIVANRSPAKHHAHADVYVALRDAFAAVTRQLENYARKQRGDVKHHEAPEYERVTGTSSKKVTSS